MTTPSHYAHRIETVIKQEYVLDHLEGRLSPSECHFIATAMKYTDRMGEKAGEPLEKDAGKAANYFYRAVKGTWIDENEEPSEKAMMRFVREHVGIPALMEQLAEECAELAHACLKFSRIERDENPTPVLSHEARYSVIEELNDVILCIKVLGLGSEENKAEQKKKLERWVERINEGIDRRAHA